MANTDHNLQPALDEQGLTASPQLPEGVKNYLIDIDGTLYFTADSGGSDTGSVDNSEETDGDESANGPTSSGASEMGLWKSDGSEGETAPGQALL